MLTQKQLGSVRLIGKRPKFHHSIMISAIRNTLWTVVISRGQSRNPQKRVLEQTIADAACQIDGVNVLVVPHLYDLPKNSESFRKC